MRKTLLILALGLLFLSTGPASAAGPAPLGVSEASLNPAGSAFEINLGAEGGLWISDYGAGEIWRVDPASPSTAAVYHIAGASPGPSDARADAQGSLWWANNSPLGLGWFTPGDPTATLYSLPGASSPYGTLLASDGSVWVSDSSGPNLYRYASGQMCRFTFQDPSISLTYLVESGGSLWTADGANNLLFQVNLVSRAFSAWQLPAGSVSTLDPQAFLPVAGGSLAWVDAGLGSLVVFDPVAQQITRYDWPAGMPGLPPYYLARLNGVYWFSAPLSHKIFSLGSSAPSSGSADLRFASPLVQTACAPAQTSTLDVTTASAPLAWTDGGSLPGLQDGAWSDYALPSAGAQPYGIAAAQDQLWVVDNATRQLLRLSLDKLRYRIYLPLIVRDPLP